MVLYLHVSSECIIDSTANRIDVTSVRVASWLARAVC
jgi:hypothetical protein